MVWIIRGLGALVFLYVMAVLATYTRGIIERGDWWSYGMLLAGLFGYAVWRDRREGHY
jgi:hypothetical protein